MIRFSLKERMREFSVRQAGRQARGMTLIEIMVVILILGMIMSLVAVAVVPQFEQAKIDTAKLQIRNFQQALDHYKIRFNKYPTTAEGIDALTHPPNNMQPFLNEVPKDPWGNDYVYVSPGSHAKAGYDIESYGPDGQSGGGDDIQSWNLDGKQGE
jgi:general secretion pathway protein G